MNPSVSQPQLTFHCDIIHRQLQALASSHHLHCVPLVVVQLLPREQYLRSFACGEGGGIQITNSTAGMVCAPTHVPTHRQSSYIVGDRASGENLHVCATHSHYGFS